MRSRWCRNDRRPALDRRRGGCARDAPGRPRRLSRLSDHAADADHPDLREVRRRRQGADGDHQRRVGALRDERRDRRRARRRTHDDRHVVAGARTDGRGRLHRRLDARADRDGARQPRPLRPDQHPLRPLRLDADPRFRRHPALRRERAGCVRPDGDRAPARRASRRAAAGARVPGRLHDHPLGRACRAPARRRGHALRRRVPHPALRARRRAADDAGSVRDAGLLLRVPPPAGGRDRAGRGRLRRARG